MGLHVFPIPIPPPPLLFTKVLCVLSRSIVSDSATPRTVAHQAPLSIGILQARILEWVAMSSSRGSSQPRAQTHGLSHSRQILYHLSHQGSPLYQQSLHFPHLYGILFFSSHSFSLTHVKKT